MRRLWPTRGKTCASLHLLPQVLSHEELREALAKESAPLMQARATYDFDPQNERELQFKKVWQLLTLSNTHTHTHTHTHTFSQFVLTQGDIIAITKKIEETGKESFPRHMLRYWMVISKIPQCYQQKMFLFQKSQRPSNTSSIYIVQ